MNKSEFPLPNEKIVYKFKHAISEKDLLRENAADEYLVCQCDDFPSGLIIYGKSYKYGDDWKPYPDTRYLIKHLLEQIGVEL